MSGRPFLWTPQEAGRLPGWRICSGSTRLMDAHPILNGSLKDIDVYDCEMSELDAIARNTGLADRAAIGAPGRSCRRGQAHRPKCQSCWRPGQCDKTLAMPHPRR